MRPFVKEGQGLPKIVPRLLWPHSQAGLALLRGALTLTNIPLIHKAIDNGFARDSDSIVLPAY